MKKFASIFASLLLACGMDLEAEPTGDATAIDDAAPKSSLAIRSDSLTGIDCGTVIAYADGEYVISEISHLEAIDRSACSYFAGNVRVAFTVPLVPTAQKPLFLPASIKDISGRILQYRKDGAPTSQLVQFVGLERAGRIEAPWGQTCPYPALKSAGTIYLEKASVSCTFPALTTVNEIELSEATKITGFNALTQVGRLVISGGVVAITGFKALANGNLIELYKEGGTDDKWTGAFPALTTTNALWMEGIDLKGFSLPKLTTVTGNLGIKACASTFVPLKAIKDIGGWLNVDERVPFEGWDHSGPATLQTIGGSLNINLGHSAVRGYAKLQSVGGTIFVKGGLIHEVSGFDSLTAVGGVIIDGTSTSVLGFAKLAKIDGSLRIRTVESSSGGVTFDAFPLLAEITGVADLTIGGTIRSYFPLLKRVGGEFRYDYNNSTSSSVTCSNGFPKLESVGGALLVTRCNGAFNSLLSVGGTLSILSLPSSLGRYAIPGFKKVNRVGGDLVLDKRAKEYGSDGTQRLLDQLIGFTGSVILK